VTLASAAFTAATPGSGAAPATPDYCKVLGTIAPVDPAAQPIHFQINLPIRWNGKALQYGGGGFNGTLITGLASLRDGAPGDPLPITRGYVTLGTDSGHQSSAFAANRIGEFGLNDEMLQNYAFASYKKVHDVGVVVMRAYYNRGRTNSRPACRRTRHHRHGVILLNGTCDHRSFDPISTDHLAPEIARRSTGNKVPGGSATSTPALLPTSIVYPQPT
jgi:Tannase and feruloyl esterase